MTMNSEYNNWMNTVQNEVIISLSPSKEKMAELELIINPSEDWDGFEALYKKAYIETVHNNITLREAQTIAEPIRIAHPDQCVSIYCGKNGFIGNTSWNDQLEMFFEYETYTPEGGAIMKARQEEAARLGQVASWE